MFEQHLIPILSYFIGKHWAGVSWPLTRVFDRVNGWTLTMTRRSMQAAVCTTGKLCFLCLRKSDANAAFLNPWSQCSCTFAVKTYRCVLSSFWMICEFLLLFHIDVSALCLQPSQVCVYEEEANISFATLLDIEGNTDEAIAKLEKLNSILSYWHLAKVPALSLDDSHTGSKVKWLIWACEWPSHLMSLCWWSDLSEAVGGGGKRAGGDTGQVHQLPPAVQELPDKD